MKKVLVFMIVMLVAGSGMVLSVSCGTSGGGGGDETYYADTDGDGYGDADVSQVLDSAQTGWVLDSTDCDDTQSAVNPGADEDCGDWTDNDCNSLTDCYDIAVCAADLACTACTDADGDGYFDVDLSCSGGNDCDDADSTVNPGVDADGDTINACEDCDDFDTTTGTGTAEVCNGLDDDCDRDVDEGDPGGGVPCDGPDSDLCLEGTTSCAAGTPACSDTTSSTIDICNGLDDDCDPASDDGDEDPLLGTDCDGPDTDLCQEGIYLCAGGVMACSDSTGDSVETCNGADDDCDGSIDEDFDVDADGYTTCSGDCDDTNALINPDALELCNGVDDDCDTAIDEEDSVDCVSFYRDDDDDGYGVTGDSRCLCSPSDPYTTTYDGDCDDSDPVVNPGAVEFCNGVDDDCDSQTDEPGSGDCSLYYLDNDDDGYGLDGDDQCLCSPSGSYTASTGSDCDDGDPDVNPAAAEVCDGADNDCNGVTDDCSCSINGDCSATGYTNPACCSTNCVDLANDANNCNGCGNVCPNHLACSGSLCLTACSDDGDCAGGYTCNTGTGFCE